MDPSAEPLAAEGGSPVRATFLPFSRPSFGEEEKRDVAAVLDSGWITTGPRVAELEAALAEASGAAHAVCLDSCTAALHVALAALDLQPGDEVVTSPLTFCSTVHAIEHAGGVPVLADVEPDTLNLDPERTAAVLGPRTRALLPVHYGGHPAEMDALLGLARARDLAVIEDAAHASGAAYRGRPVGAIGDATCLSFYATKNMTTAEGGALLTDRPELAERARVLALHGLTRDAWGRYTAAGAWHYDVVASGYKYNMTDLEAALGLRQLQRLPGFIARRRELAARLTAGLAGEPAIQTPAVREEVDPAWHLYPIRLRAERLTVDRDRFLEDLRAENIGVSVHFIPIHFHTYFKGRLGTEGDFPVAEDAFRRLISLPIYPAMTDADADDVIAAVRKVASHHRRS